MECNLSHMPIGKNLLYVASQLMRCVKNNDKLNLTNSSWIWSNVENNTSSKNWDYYFNQWSYPNQISDDLLLMSNCCESVFNPKKEFIKYEVASSKKIIGLHIRRGDAKYYKIPKVQDVSNYIDIVKNYNPNEYCIYCASDSISEVVNEFKEKLSEFEIHFSKYSEKIPVIPKGTDIEMYCMNNKQIIEDVVISSITDIYNLSKSEVFIGPFKDSVFALFVSTLLYNKNKKTIDIVSRMEEIKLEYLNLGIQL